MSLPPRIFICYKGKQRSLYKPPTTVTVTPCGINVKPKKLPFQVIQQLQISYREKLRNLYKPPTTVTLTPSLVEQTSNARSMHDSIVSPFRSYGAGKITAAKVEQRLQISNGMFQKMGGRRIVPPQMDGDNKDDVKPTPGNIESDDKEKQSTRCFLRERFLRAVTGLVGKECTIHMCLNTNVGGIFRGCDIEFETLLLEKLKTPLAEIPHSKIRSSDVHYLEFKNFTNS